VNKNIMYVQLTVFKRKKSIRIPVLYLMSLVQILAHRPITLTEGFHGFPQSRQTVWLAPQIRSHVLRKYKSEKKNNVILPRQRSRSLLDLLVVSPLQSVDIGCNYSLLWMMMPINSLPGCHPYLFFLHFPRHCRSDRLGR
jgi:hypothetical protein